MVFATYAILVAFVFLPFLLVFKISLSNDAEVQPPYLPWLDLTEGWGNIRDFLQGLSLDNYRELLDEEYIGPLIESLTIAAVSTAILIVVGFPLAYAIARSPRALQPILIVLVILPFCTSSLIRTYAWKYILLEDGLLNRALLALHVLTRPVEWFPGRFATYVGMVYSYLPFMVLPLYAALHRMDPALLEAAADLGAPPRTAFWTVTLPLTRSGVIAGSLLCFIPIAGEYVIPDMLGGSEAPMIGQKLWDVFFGSAHRWTMAAALTMALFALFVVPMVLYESRAKRLREER
jgi:putrescine transport system permease protein